MENKDEDPSPYVTGHTQQQPYNPCTKQDERNSYFDQQRYAYLVFHLINNIPYITPQTTEMWPPFNNVNGGQVPHAGVVHVVILRIRLTESDCTGTVIASVLLHAQSYFWRSDSICYPMLLLFRLQEGSSTRKLMSKVEYFPITLVRVMMELKKTHTRVTCVCCSRCCLFE